MSKTVHTYIYYKKQFFAFFAVLACCMSALFAWVVYDMLVYDMYDLQNIAEWRIFSPVMLFMVFNLLIWIVFLLMAFSVLMHRGPVYIITPEGIMDCTFGFVPWDQIEEISGALQIEKIPGVLRNKVELGQTIIKLKHPKQHFKGLCRSYFGWRTIVLAPMTMFSVFKEV